jgi:putative endonuclease
VRFLLQQGLTVLAQNERIGRLEVDVVVRDGDAVAIVEVRTRGPGAWQTALGSIDRAKQSRLRQAGRRLWAKRYRYLDGVDRLRFDVVGVDLDSGDEPLIEYVKAAF